jgi:hypothetical protein
MVCSKSPSEALAPASSYLGPQTTSAEWTRRLAKSAGDAYVVGRLGGSPRIRNTVLDSGSLAEAIEAMRLVGACVIAGHRARQVAAEPHLILDAGCRAFSDWPLSFDRLLDSLADAADAGLGRWGAAVTYGPLHERLGEFGDGEIGTVMKAGIRRHAAAHGVSFSKPVFGAVVKADKFVTVSEAARRFEMSEKNARGLLAAKGLIANETRRGTPVKVSAGDVDRLAAARRERFGVPGLAERLGIGRMQARLVAPIAFGADREWFTAGDVDGLLHKLLRDLSDRFESTGTAPLPKACRLARCALPSAVKAILAGELQPVGVRKATGLARIAVGISDLRLLGKATRGVMTFDDVAAQLGIKWETVRDLVRLRLISQSGPGIAPSEIDAFRRSYVSGAELARERHTNSRALIGRLAAAGITPAAAPPQCRQVFYSRSELAAAGWKFAAPATAAA